MQRLPLVWSMALPSRSRRSETLTHTHTLKRVQVRAGVYAKVSEMIYWVSMKCKVLANS